MPKLQLECQRQFAVEVVRLLRTAGFTAYWAGGCVRDQLLGRTPKDFDVATSATPQEVRRVFKRFHTLSVGAAFGVISVVGPKEAGQIEVATFRSDAAYSDGRHPDSVAFSTAREDALRRDFTINGLFYDPIGEEIIDFVGGRDDLAQRLLRAIGDPRERFSEDKLRLLRAVRFAATFPLEIDSDTLEAVRQMAPEINVVSPERIAMEMRRMLVGPGRCRAVRLLIETGLAAEVLGEIVPTDAPGQERLDQTLAALDRVSDPSFPLALAGLVGPVVDRPAAVQIGRRWRLSNDEIGRLGWLVEHQGTLHGAAGKPFSKVQPILIAPGIEDLLMWEEAVAAVEGGVGTGQGDGVEDGVGADIAWCRAKLALPRSSLEPVPLLTGDDLIGHGVPPGPQFRPILQRVRDAQLDDQIHTRTEAFALVDRLRGQS